MHAPGSVHILIARAGGQQGTRVGAVLLASPSAPTRLRSQDVNAEDQATLLAHLDDPDLGFCILGTELDPHARLPGAGLDALEELLVWEAVQLQHALCCLGCREAAGRAHQLNLGIVHCLGAGSQVDSAACMWQAGL